MNSVNKSLLKIENLSVQYRHDSEVVQAVSNATFDLNRNEDLGIIGESGCGKSSLVMSILKLLKNATVNGKIIFKGEDILALSESDLNRIRWKDISIAFQNSVEVLNPVLTIEAQICESIKKHYNLSTNELKKKVRYLYEIVGLDNIWLDSYPHQLSGGMLQRILLAMALACNPKILILDEPTTSLDALSKNDLVEMLKKLKQRFGFTIILISHDLDIINALTTKLVVMYNGRIIESGITKEIIDNPCHTYTRGFLNSSPQLYKYKDLWGITSDLGLTLPEKGCSFYYRCPQRAEICLTSVPYLQEVLPNRLIACHKGGIETVLRAENVKKHYMLKNKTIVKALNGVDIILKSGEVVALVGESGSGKSTLAHILAGTIKGDEGKVYFFNKETKNNWATKMIGGMQIVFQDPISATNHRMTVVDVVKEPLDIIKYKDQDYRKERVIEVLTMVHMPVSESFLNRYCYSLSGGQRQRLAIAKALITKPRLLIADEITSMLDPSTQANFLREVKKIQNESGFTLLYITHDLHLARKISDRVYIMQSGKIIEGGPVFKIFDNPKYPYTQKLMKTLELNLSGV